MDYRPVLFIKEFIGNACNVITHNACGTARYNDLKIGVKDLVCIFDYIAQSVCAAENYLFLAEIGTGCGLAARIACRALKKAFYHNAAAGSRMKYRHSTGYRHHRLQSAYRTGIALLFNQSCHFYSPLLSQECIRLLFKPPFCIRV